LRSPKICCLQTGDQETSGVVQSASEGLRTRGLCYKPGSAKVKDTSSDIHRQEKIHVLPPEENSFFPGPFVLSRPSVDWMGLGHVG
jgi:hypothetical protein